MGSSSPSGLHPKSQSGAHPPGAFRPDAYSSPSTSPWDLRNQGVERDAEHSRDLSPFLVVGPSALPRFPSRRARWRGDAREYPQRGPRPRWCVSRRPANVGFERSRFAEPGLPPGPTRSREASRPRRKVPPHGPDRPSKGSSWPLRRKVSKTSSALRPAWRVTPLIPRGDRTSPRGEPLCAEDCPQLKITASHPCFGHAPRAMTRFGRILKF